jgi:hypothetical protein
MATFYVTNSLYPGNPQLFTITLKQIVKSIGEPATDYHYNNRGEHYWEVQVSTSGLTAAGSPVDYKWIDVKATEESVHELISNAITEMCTEIDWSQQGEFELQQDRNAPRITSQYPAPGQTNVPIDSSITLVVEELLPGKGIDISTMSFKVKDVPITPTVTGDPFKYTLTYKPKSIK